MKIKGNRPASRLTINLRKKKIKINEKLIHCSNCSYSCKNFTLVCDMNSFYYLYYIFIIFLFYFVLLLFLVNYYYYVCNDKVNERKSLDYIIFFLIHNFRT